MALTFCIFPNFIGFPDFKFIVSSFSPDNNQFNRSLFLPLPLPPPLLWLAEKREGRQEEKVVCSAFIVCLGLHV